VPLKSIGHRNNETGAEEVEQEPMSTAREQAQQRQPTAKVQRKSGAGGIFFSFFY
jgi:hypothetical protein